MNIPHWKLKSLYAGYIVDYHTSVFNSRYAKFKLSNGLVPDSARDSQYQTLFDNIDIAFKELRKVNTIAVKDSDSKQFNKSIRFTEFSRKLKKAQRNVDFSKLLTFDEYKNDLTKQLGETIC